MEESGSADVDVDIAGTNSEEIDHPLQRLYKFLGDDSYVNPILCKTVRRTPTINGYDRMSQQSKVWTRVEVTLEGNVPTTNRHQVT